MKNFPKTLVEALDANQDENKKITYIKSKEDEKEVSYPELKQRALGVLHHLQNFGAVVGSHVIIHLEDNEQFIDAFWACQYGGLIAAPIAIGTSDGHRQKVFSVFKKLDSPYVITTKKAWQRLYVYAHENDLEEFFLEFKKKVFLLSKIESLGVLGERANITPDDTSFIQFSSGSTGEPKGVVLTHKNLMTNLFGIIECSEFDHQDSFFSWMPLTHDLGIIGFHMTPLVVNIDQCILPTELFIRRPMLWLQKSSEKKSTILASPNFGYKYVLKRFKVDDQTDLDLSSVRLIFNGAEPISASLCREFNEKMKSFGLDKHAMFTVYGLAEACLVVTFPKLNLPLSTVHVMRDTIIPNTAVTLVNKSENKSIELVKVGYPITGTQMEVCNEDGKKLPENTVGRILIHGENVTKGYFDAEALNKEVISTDGWLDTGDQGFINKGQLVITGRTKDLIIVNGQNYFAHDLESICEHVDGVELGKAVVCGVLDAKEGNEEIIVFILFRGDLEEFYPLSNAIRRQFVERAGLDVAAIIPVKSVPKTTSGKVQRYLLGENYCNGMYKELEAGLAELSETASNVDQRETTNLELELLEICNMIIADQRVGLNDNIFEMGASSLKLAQIHEKIDEMYPDVVELSDFFDCPTVEEIAVLIGGRIGD
jgi:acyl-CoA synthetase (AMP-forming)/AMP-acid ligase II